jgi:hypothetical protein
METQLVLMEEPVRDWQLDEQTRRAGRRGLELARRALVEAQRRTAA